MRRATGFALVILAITPALVRGTAETDAAFNASKSNPSNSFQAAASFGGIMLATGSYTGTAADDRAITGVGFQPNVVIVKANTAAVPMIRTSTIVGDAAKPLSGATAPVANTIQSLDANGFTVGTDSRTNGSGVVYQWTAIRAHAGSMSVGSFTGNGTSGRTVNGVGFGPEYVAVLSAGAHAAVQRYAGTTAAFRFDADTGSTTRITGFAADGFTLGNDSTVNATGVVYHYLAFNDGAAGIKVGSYTGNAADNRSITGVGFQPQYIGIRSGDTATARAGAHRPVSLAGDAAQFYTATANATNAIQALQTDGFQLGTAVTTNAGGSPYNYLALRGQ